MAPLGQFNWTQPGTIAVFVNGVQLSGYASVGWTKPDVQPAALRTLAGGHILQSLYRGLSAPSSLRPRPYALKVQSGLEDDYFALDTAEERGTVVPCYLDIWQTDTWDAVSGQSQFSTSRVIAYGSSFPNITTTTRPTRAFVMAAGTTTQVEQTVIYGGSPGVGQVSIGTAINSQNNAVVTQPLNPGDVLIVRYYPLVFAAFSQAQRGVETANGMDYSATLDEKLLGTWN